MLYVLIEEEVEVEEERLEGRVGVARKALACLVLGGREGGREGRGG
jgi:hypothetical protein